MSSKVAPSQFCVCVERAIVRLLRELNEATYMTCRKQWPQALWKGPCCSLYCRHDYRDVYRSTPLGLHHAWLLSVLVSHRS